MKRKHTKLLQACLAAVIAVSQVFLYLPVSADETAETAAETTTEITETETEQTTSASKKETPKETAEETDEEPCDETGEETSEETTAEYKRKHRITSAKNGKEFVKGVSRLSRKYRIAASTKKRMPDLSGADGVDYGGSCVLSFDSKADYDNALKELENKDIDYSLDGSVSICSSVDIPSRKDVKINPDAKTRIVMIDTGSEIANEKISLLEDDGSDKNGHGTSMATLILNETEDAYIISVKAIGDNGKGKLADVYAGVRYAMDHNADYILMAISLKDNGNYESFVSLVMEAISKGIRVIASAGNNSSNASGYIPAGIKGVITAGAIDDDGFKLDISNYGNCVDYYVHSGSTSEAAAILAGLMIEGKESECATSYYTDGDENVNDEEPDQDEPDEDGEFTVDKSKMTWPTKTNLVDAGYRDSDDFADAVIAACKAMKGAEYGTGNGQVDCMRYVNLAYAQALNLISGLKVNSKGKIPGLKRSKGNVTFNGFSLTKCKYHLVDGCTTWSTKKPHNIGHPGGINIKDNGGLEECLKKLGAKKGSILLFGGAKKNEEFKWTHAAIYAGTGKTVYDAPGGSQTTGVPYSKSEGGSSKKKYTHVAVLNFASYELPANVTIVKSSKDTQLTDNNACYSLEGTKYGFYNASGTLLHEFVLDENGKTGSYQIPDMTKKYYISEISAGPGYMLSTTKYNVNPSSSTGSLITVKAEDVPLGSEAGLLLEKQDPEGWYNITGHGMNEARFRVDYYDSFIIESYKDLKPSDGSALPQPKASVEIGSSFVTEGKAEFRIDADTLRDAADSGYFYNFKGTTLPLGTYVITEIKAPEGYMTVDPSKPLIMKIKQEGNTAVTYFSADPDTYKVLDDRILLNETAFTARGLFRKKVTVPEQLNANTSLYSPEGTTYVISHKESGKTAVTLVFGKDGKVSEIKYPDGVKPDSQGDDGYVTLPIGEYKAKETHSGYGLYLNTEEKTFTVEYNKNSEIEFSDEPVFTGFDLLLKKVRNSSLSDEVLSLIPVEGAEFTLSYYAAFYEDDSYKDKEPDSKWILRSDSEGKVMYDKNHFVSGDSLFTDSESAYIAVQGTYVITETKAPAGTELNNEARVIVVRFAKDIVKGSPNDPANKKATASTVSEIDMTGIKDGQIDYYNDYNTSISTKAVSTANGTKEIAAEKGVGITDTLTYKNLLPGYQYKITAWIVRSDGSVVVNPFDTTMQIKSDEERSGTFKIQFTVDASVLKGETLTVMEEVYITDPLGTEHLYLDHKDINNKEQQVTVPDIKTELIDVKIDEFNNADNSKIVSYGKDVTLTDLITYKNLIPGNTYKMIGTLLDKETGKTILNSKGKVYAASVEFIPEKSDGTVKVEFEHVDTTIFTGKVVAGEKLNSNGIVLITHYDTEDEMQTVKPVMIKTTAKDSNNGTKTLNFSETADITDTVTYKDLKPGKKYSITATLMDRATGKAYTDIDGNTYVKTVEFTAQTEDGTVEVKFEKVKISYEYKELVVFEDLKDDKNGASVAVHADINDNDQTVYRPQASTVASSKSGSKTINENSGNAKITDKVMYKGFTPGNTYRAVATLYKTNGKQMMNPDGTPVANSVTFTPKKSNGTIEVPLTFNVDDLNPGEAVVIFENIYDAATQEEIASGKQKEDIEIVRHADLNNKDQTLKYKIPTVPKTGEETSPALMVGLLLVSASAGPMGFALRVKRGAKCRAPRRSRRKPDVSSLLCSLKRRMRDGSSRVWRNLIP